MKITNDTELKIAEKVTNHTVDTITDLIPVFQEMLDKRGTKFCVFACEVIIHDRIWLNCPQMNTLLHDAIASLVDNEVRIKDRAKVAQGPADKEALQQMFNQNQWMQNTLRNYLKVSRVM